MTTQTTIANCRLGYECPTSWQDLQPAKIATERHCGTCNRTVHFCNTDNELAESLRHGHCVAFTRYDTDTDEPITFVGDPDKPSNYQG